MPPTWKKTLFISHVSTESEFAQYLKRRFEKDFLGSLDVFVSSDQTTIEQLPRSESVELLNGRVPNLSPALADQVAEALGDLPLALDQAAGLLRDTGLPVTDYFALLNAEASRVLGHSADPAEPDRTVTASWAVAFNRLAADNPAALLLLSLVAWLAPEPIPLTVFTQYPDRLPDPLPGVASAAVRNR